MRVSNLELARSSGLRSFEWIANPDTCWGNFRVAGYSTGSENFRSERLDEYIGDCVNSRAFPATWAFFRTAPVAATSDKCIRYRQ